jgi:mRNA interferase MazF
MTGYSPGDVVLVRFPFTDLSSAKRRPAVIVSRSDYSAAFGDVVVIALTSQPQPDAGLLLADWNSAGLPKQTWAKPLIGTLSGGLIVRALGSLSLRDWNVLRYALDLILDPQWRAPATP